MDSLTFANSVAQPVYDATSDDSSAATFVSAAGTTDSASEPSDQQVSFATSAFDPYNSIFSAQVSSLGGDDEFGPTNVFSQAQTTLAYSRQDNASGTTLTTGDSSDTASLALLGQYMASNVAAWSAGSIGGMTTNETHSIASNTASVTSANSEVANPVPTGVTNVNNSSASSVMLSATAEKAPPEITAGLVWAYSMSDDAFGIGTAPPHVTAPPSGGNAFGSVTTTMPDAAPSSGGDGFVVTNAGLSNGNPVANITTQNSGLVSVGAAGGAMPDPAAPLQNTWQQNLALMGNYMASTFIPPAFGDGGRPDPGALLPVPAQGALAPQILADHQNST